MIVRPFIYDKKIFVGSHTGPTPTHLPVGKAQLNAPTEPYLQVFPAYGSPGYVKFSLPIPPARSGMMWDVSSTEPTCLKVEFTRHWVIVSWRALPHFEYILELLVGCRYPSDLHWLGCLPSFLGRIPLGRILYCCRRISYLWLRHRRYRYP